MRNTDRKQASQMPDGAASAQAGGNLPGRCGRGRPRRRNGFAGSIESPALEVAQRPLNSLKSQGGLDLTEKVKELIRLAREQGHLTYEDVNDALPDDLVTPEDLDQVHTKLRNLEIEIIDPAEVDRGGRAAESGEDEERVRYDILDDPVRMYLPPMGQVP